MNSSSHIRLSSNLWFLIFSTGFALFAMFFGSGNLVFPLLIGQAVGDHYGYAIAGLVLTGVLIPFLGLLGTLLFEGSVELFFGNLGKKVALILSFLILSLLGPFGVVPRCIAVAWGSFTEVFSSCPGFFFNALSCGVIFIFSSTYRRMIPLIGSFLTPILLISVAFIVVLGVLKGVPPTPTSFSIPEAFQNGIVNGYQTMDLLAAFFFSQAAILHIRFRLRAHNLPEEKLSSLELKVAFFASLIGAFLLALVYIAFVYLGASYQGNLVNIPAEKLLITIASFSLGAYAKPVVSIAVILACLTTAIALTTAFAKFMQEQLTLNRLGFKTCTAITLVIAFFIAALEFQGISKFLAPILTVLYPGLIVLTLFNIFQKLFNFQLSRVVLFIMVGSAMFIALK
jgi:LIVCS family branched-chain amino acid:cation transporter